MKRQKCILLSECSQSEKGHKLYDSRYMTFWKSPNYGDSGGKKNQWLPGVTGEQGIERQSTEGFQDVKLFCMIL